MFSILENIRKYSKNPNFHCLNCTFSMILRSEPEARHCQLHNFSIIVFPGFAESLNILSTNRIRSHARFVLSRPPQKYEGWHDNGLIIVLSFIILYTFTMYTLDSYKYSVFIGPSRYPSITSIYLVYIIYLGKVCYSQIRKVGLSAIERGIQATFQGS